jgi:hypothetical protein
MFINHDRKIVYIHMPKSAGTFLTRFFVENINGSKKINFNGDTHYGIELALNNINDIDNYTFFSTVRNPWDWYVSLYEYVHNTNRHEWILFGKEGLNFESWLLNIVNCKTNNNIINSRNKEEDKTSTFSLYKNLLKSQLGCGWLTHRLIYSSCINWLKFFEKLSLSDFESHNKVSIIKTEKLIDIENLDILTKNEIDLLKSFSKKNVNHNRKKYSEYYNSYLMDLVLSKEKFIINKFGYNYGNI